MTIPQQDDLPLAPQYWPGKGRRRWLLLLFIVGLLAALTTTLFFVSRMLVGSRPVAQVDVTALAVGQRGEVIVQITAVTTEGALMGWSLAQTDDGTYQRAGRSIRIQWESDTPVVTGQRQDVRPGAVLRVHGQMTSQEILKAERLAVLTDQVTVR